MIADSADDFSMQLKSVPYGREINENIRLEISLIGYPSATPAIFETRLVYRECLPESFEAPYVGDQVLTVGDPKKKLNVEFN